eukprot:TRINITY_DN5884_c0_g1_i4.p1 TRINITY_DN5884_c0_g1~~TRINITY_DN5884_c0_g1_i4.p1  ORF type:complete len:268 (+),score=76.36 TRINITY_DN5884_c0_g1_i4:128-931(+)
MPSGANTQFKRFNARPAALLTDIEGVFMDIERRVTVSAIVEVYKRREVEITFEDAAMAPPVEELSEVSQTQLRNVLRNVVRHTADKWAAVKGAPPTEWDLEAMFKEMPQAVADLMKIAHPHPAAAEILSTLAGQGMKIGVTVEFDEEKTPAWAKHAEASGLQVDGSGSAAEAGIGGSTGAPPLPWRAITLASSLGVYPFDRCIRVANSIWGVQEGLNAGMWTVGVAPNAEASALMSCNGVHYQVSDVSELPGVVDEIALRMRMGDKP